MNGKFEKKGCDELRPGLAGPRPDGGIDRGWERTASFILSNSSIKQTPLSARTSAPPSSVHSLVTGSFLTLAVSPTALAPWPVVKTARLAVFSTYLRN
jgi:hypothetical protein